MRDSKNALRSYAAERDHMSEVVFYYFMTFYVTHCSSQVELYGIMGHSTALVILAAQAPILPTPLFAVYSCVSNPVHNLK